MRLKMILWGMLALLACRTSRNSTSDKDDGTSETKMVDGFRVQREQFDADLKKVRAQASFDLNCDGAQLHFRVLGLGTQMAADDWASDFGVSGCGQRARYSRVGMVNPIGGMTGSWILQSKEKADEPPASPKGTTQAL